MLSAFGIRISSHGSSDKHTLCTPAAAPAPSFGRRCCRPSVSTLFPSEAPTGEFQTSNRSPVSTLQIPTCSYDMSRIICAVQIPTSKQVLNHADYTGPARKHKLLQIIQIIQIMQIRDISIYLLRNISTVGIDGLSDV